MGLNRRFFLTLLFLPSCISATPAVASPFAKTSGDKEAMANKPAVFFEKPPKARLAEPFKITLKCENLDGNSVEIDTSALESSDFAFAGIEKKEGGEYVEFGINLIPFAVGASTLPSMDVHYENAGGGEPGHYSTPAETVEIAPYTDNPPKDIKDIVPPVKFHSPWILILIAVAAIAVATLVLILKKRKSPEAAASAARAKTPFEKAMGRIKSSSRLWESGEFKAFYTEISETVRDFLREEYRIPADTMTTADLLKQIRKAGYPKRLSGEIKELLEFSDLVKFARLKPKDEDKERDLEKAETALKKWHESKTPANGGGKA